MRYPCQIFVIRYRPGGWSGNQREVDGQVRAGEQSGEFRLRGARLNAGDLAISLFINHLQNLLTHAASTQFRNLEGILCHLLSGDQR